MLARFLALAAVGAAAVLMRNQAKKTGGQGRMSAFSESVDVDVPLSTAYDQWTQFETFPRFMAGVHEVRQLDDTHLHWRASVGGKEEEWESEITQQIPDRLIAWRSTSGPRNEGMVTFHSLSDARTRVELHMSYEPRGMAERMGDAMGAVSMRASGNLKRFKEFIESRGTETGAWRGSVGMQGGANALGTGRDIGGGPISQ